MEGRQKYSVLIDWQSIKRDVCLVILIVKTQLSVFKTGFQH